MVASWRDSVARVSPTGESGCRAPAGGGREARAVSLEPQAAKFVVCGMEEDDRLDLDNLQHLLERASIARRLSLVTGDEHAHRLLGEMADELDEEITKVVLHIRNWPP
jgi:hypothetical protein